MAQAASNAPVVPHDSVDWWTHVVTLVGTLLTVLGGIGLATLKLRSGFYELRDEMRRDLTTTKEALVASVNGVEQRLAEIAGELRDEIHGCVTNGQCDKRHDKLQIEGTRRVSERLVNVLTRLDSLERSHSANHTSGARAVDGVPI